MLLDLSIGLLSSSSLAAGRKNLENPAISPVIIIRRQQGRQRERAIATTHGPWEWRPPLAHGDVSPSINYVGLAEEHS
jgi:hypothetical protein